jgi:hypothetical protein
LISNDATPDSTPLGLKIIQHPIPRVVATLQPWALVPNPVGVLMNEILATGSSIFPALQDV